MNKITIYQGHVLDRLKQLPSESIQMCVTSPPYWGLRSYIDDEKEKSSEIGLEKIHDCLGWATKNKCGECYICKLTEVFEEVKRVLRKDGILYINIGDSYAGSGKAGSSPEYQKRHTQFGQKERKERFGQPVPVPKGLKPKDLHGMPWRLAFALQASGWYLRCDLIWNKPSCKPECLSPDTYVFIKYKNKVKRVTLNELSIMEKPYPKILTPTGWKNIINIWETYKENVIKFDAAKVSTIISSQEHRWPISHDRRNSNIEYKSSNNLRDKGYLDYLLYQPIDRWLEGKTLKILGYELDYELGWLLGIYTAEGGFNDLRGFRCKFTINANENFLADKIIAIISKKFNVNIQHRVINNYQIIRFSNKPWYNIVKRIVSGISITKKLNLDYILNSPREFRKGFWEGYVDGDGHIRNNGVSVATASKDLCDGMAVLASSLGIITSKRTNFQKDKRTKKIYISYWLLTPYLKKRKYKNKIFKQITIRNKENLLGKYKMIDIEVEDGLFIINDGLITHNSTKDRPTRAHEYVFLFSKSQRYFYDQIAVKEKTKDGNFRNQRSVWNINPSGFPEAHFAVFPSNLISPMIKAGTSEYGCCSKCKSPWMRKTGRLCECGNLVETQKKKCLKCGKINNWKDGREVRPEMLSTDWSTPGIGTPRFPGNFVNKTISDGWQSTCNCNSDIVPCTVLDPFFGSGTTGLVSCKLGRNCVGIELNPEYVNMAEKRIKDLFGLMTEIKVIKE